jgi:hypothetical protein
MQRHPSVYKESTMNKHSHFPLQDNTALVLIDTQERNIRGFWQDIYFNE